MQCKVARPAHIYESSATSPVLPDWCSGTCSVLVWYLARQRDLESGDAHDGEDDKTNGVLQVSYQTEY